MKARELHCHRVHERVLASTCIGAITLAMFVATQSSTTEVSTMFIEPEKLVLQEMPAPVEIIESELITYAKEAGDVLPAPTEFIPLIYEEEEPEGRIVSFKEYNEAGLVQCITYMGWQAISDKSSPQWKLVDEVTEVYGRLPFDEHGIGKIEDRYVVAVTCSSISYPDPVSGGISTGIAEVGDFLDVHMKDGQVIKCIVADVKSEKDTFSCYGHVYKKVNTSVVEFVVDRDIFYERDGGTNNDILRSAVYGYTTNAEIVFEYIEVLGNYFENGGSYEE